MTKRIEDHDLLPVELVNNQLWKKGYAENIAFSEVTHAEETEDFAFWDLLRNEYVDVHGNLINRIPKYKVVYGFVVTE